MAKRPISRLLTLAVFSVLLAACGREEVPPEQMADRANAAAELFRQGCVAFDGAADKVRAFADNEKLTALNAEEIGRLPAGFVEPDALAVWKKTQDGADYYLSLTGDSCSVKTARADETLIRKQFMVLVENPPKGLNNELRTDQASESPIPIRQLSYAWRASGSPEETLLTVKTTPSDQLPVQAVFYLTHQSYNGKPVLVQ
ncbi:hypothetical protein HMPREF2600_10855 [Neisseria sp. HMSC077D05]|uniref:NMCC_0638 family (lipo)protein n=1 Tax=Neisseria sp. HMSC077D05 TaxID=1715079 RepID=UPI0008A5F0D7|nr:hypothetical protein [Neisseria sp. HMSC077D05]OFN31207.1 hypothetical protein HMPREF2600_10855 [Neisseria sp. HMSC077D05]